MQNSAKRQSFILDLLKEEGFVTVSDLSDRLDVSEVTIRKDLRTLEERDLLYRTHGGATRTDPYVLDRPVDEKAGLHAAQKQRIGKAAAALVEAADSIILASGTTVLEVARHLRGSRSLTVVTAALNAALELRRLPDVEILLLGGLLRRSSTSVVGPFAEQMLRKHTCHKLFLGVDGFDLDFGLTTANTLEAHLNQVMIEAAQHTIVVTDASKFGRRGFGRICGVDVIDHVITDDGVPEAVVGQLEERGVDVTIA